MSQIAKRVFLDKADIDRLDHWVTELAVNAKVKITMFDGRVVEGIVMVTPTVQVFRDGNDVEGVNGVVKLEASDLAHGDQIVWLSDIKDLAHLDSVRKGVSRA